MSSILLVDDDLNFLNLQDQNLSAEGYQCFSASTADQALTLLDENQIDLLVIDIKMPGKTGIELLPEIKEKFPDLAIIMASGVEDMEIASRCFELGADDYLIKPFRLGRILISVRNALEKHALSLANRSHQVELERQLAAQEEKIKASQSMLIQQEKLAAIGQLAAGVAHEINNPLGFVISNLSSLAKYGAKFEEYVAAQGQLLVDLPEEVQQRCTALKKEFKLDIMLEDIPELVAETLEGSNRILKIVQGLKCFSRTDAEAPAPVDINKCIENAISIVWNEIKYTAQLERDLGELPPVQGFQQQLAQVFMNLLVNAGHAIEKDGLIRLRSRHEGDRVVITLSDNGCGISPDNLVRIFEPFFTTKGEGKGTGLGMSIVQEILQRHEGTISVESTVGQGTEFTISLPAGT